MQSQKPISLLRILVLSLSFLPLVPVYAQEQDQFFTLPDYKAIKESYFRLNDSILQAEIGSFTFIGSLLEMSNDAGLKEFEVQFSAHDSLNLVFEDVSLSISVARFRPFDHQLGFVPGENYLFYIDQRPYWGFDGRIPQRKIKSVVVNYAGFSVELPPESYFDLFEPNLCRRARFLFIRERMICHTRAFLSADNNRLYIHMVNGRYPLYYEVTWILQNGRYIGRILDYSN